MRYKQKGGLKKLGGLALAVLVIGNFVLLYYTLAEETSALPLDSPQETSSQDREASGGASQSLREMATALISVPYISQEGLLPSGCETVSAVMLLQYYGWETNVYDFIDGCLPCSDFWYEDGQLTNVSPNECFIGDPYQTTGLGCYAPVMEDALNTFLAYEATSLRAVNTTGTDLQELCRRYIAQDTPVLVWASMEMRPLQEGMRWKLSGSDDFFTWLSNEHCLVLVGYNDDSYFFNDPYRSAGLVAYDKALVERRYQELGMQSLVLQD